MHSLSRRWLAPSLLMIAMVAQVTIPPEPWLPPLQRPLQVEAAFHLPLGPYQAGHRGIDLPAHPGAKIRSPVAGTVKFVGTVAAKPVMTIEVNGHTLLSFEPMVSELQVGDRIVRGQPIGEVSVGGHCESHCLHLGVRVQGKYVNPLRYFWAKPVLLPW